MQGQDAEPFYLGYIYIRFWCDLLCVYDKIRYW